MYIYVYIIHDPLISTQRAFLIYDTMQILAEIQERKAIICCACLQYAPVR